MKLNLDNVGELIRFVMTGGVATLANMMVVWLVRPHLAVPPSIALGLGAGMIVSFALMKVFAFRSHDWSGAHGEVVRFLIVYAVGTVAYFGAALAVETLLAGMNIPVRLAAIGGVFAGGLIMAVTSYVGHRNFTYRQPRRGRAL